MNIVMRALAFVGSLRAVADRSAWDWRRRPRCGESLPCEWGSYARRPWFLDGRHEVRVPRHFRDLCRRTYAEGGALLVAGSWYAREVHRLAVGHWRHRGSSVRRTAELLRSLMGRPERWLVRRPPAEPPPAGSERRLSAATVERWR